MPKPYLLRRASGLYARFLVPADLRPLVGSRYIVRPLHAPSGDLARLAAARMAVALSQAFAMVRAGGGMTDFKKLLEDAKRAAEQGDTYEWSASNVRVGGISFGAVQTSGAKDTADFLKVLKLAAEMEAKAVAAVEAAELAGDLLSVAIEKHLDDLERGKRAKDTITESRHTLRLLLGIIGDMPVGEVNGDHIRAFRDAVRWWPGNATVRPEYRDLSVRDTIAAGKRDQVDEPSRHTYNKHRQRLSAFFNPLATVGAIKVNPVKGNWPEIDTDADPETGRAFTPDELQAIFSDAFVPWAVYPHRWWGPILGMYSGARVSEIAQLYQEDITCEEGIWGFHVNNRFPGQKIKGKPSRRFVPLAQPVLDAGFLTFVADMKAHGHPRLFPHLPAGTMKNGKPNGLGYGRQLSRQFGTYADKLGIEEGVRFHAFRHTISTALDRAGFSEIQTARITGHKVKGSVLAKHYIDPRTIAERAAILAAFKPAVVLPDYTPGQFAHTLKRRADLHP